MGVQIDKDKALPGFAGHTLQGMTGFTHVGEIPTPRDVFEASIEMPGPAMKRAIERLTKTRAFLAE